MFLFGVASVHSCFICNNWTLLFLRLGLKTIVDFCCSKWFNSTMYALTCCVAFGVRERIEKTNFGRIVSLKLWPRAAGKDKRGFVASFFIINTILHFDFDCFPSHQRTVSRLGNCFCIIYKSSYPVEYLSLPVHFSRTLQRRMKWQSVYTLPELL